MNWGGMTSVDVYGFLQNCMDKFCMRNWYGRTVSMVGTTVDWYENL